MHCFRQKHSVNRPLMPQTVVSAHTHQTSTHLHNLSCIHMPTQMHDQLLQHWSDGADSLMHLYCILKLCGNLQYCCAGLFIGKTVGFSHSSPQFLSSLSFCFTYTIVPPLSLCLSQNICLSQLYWLLSCCQLCLLDTDGSAKDAVAFSFLQLAQCSTRRPGRVSALPGCLN